MGGGDGRVGPGTVALSPSPNPAVMMHQLIFVVFLGGRKAAGGAGASEPGEVGTAQGLGPSDRARGVGGAGGG